jgi:hypothetical protein
MNIDIIKTHNTLSREVYRFWFNTDNVQIIIKLDKYASQYKQSTRHTKWLNNGFYDRLISRDCTVAKPIISDEIKIQLKAELIRILDRTEIE